MTQDSGAKDGVIDVNALYLGASDSTFEDSLCRVVEEDALHLKVDAVGDYTLMWTPTTHNDEAQAYTLDDGILGDEQRPEGLCLALGFALSEGLISQLSDIKSVAVCPREKGVVKVHLQNPEQVKVSRANVVINSSCGICGPRDILQDNALNLSSVAETLRVNHTQFAALMATMRQGQTIFEQTGGSHAAAIFDPDGTVLAVAEDLGRHNAMDKAIGIVLLQRGNISGCGIVLSSRLSLEMVLKAVRAGLEVMLAVSAPTSLAIEVADKFGVTLCGFVRDARATVYTHPQRITGRSAAL